MKQLLLVIALSLAINGCSDPKKEKNNNTDSIPQTSISVNKEYDKNGNIISYDSTYAHYYSNIKDNPFKRDSIFNLFKNQFNQKYFFSNEPYFNSFFFQDSLLKYDFYKKDFFSNRFRDNVHRMDSLFGQMDVMKDDFFKNQFSQKNNTNKK